MRLQPFFVAALLLVLYCSVAQAQPKVGKPLSGFNNVKTASFDPSQNGKSLNQQQNYANKDPALSLKKPVKKRVKKVAFVKKTMSKAKAAVQTEYKKVKDMHKKDRPRNDAKRQEYAQRMEAVRAKLITAQQQSGKTSQVVADIVKHTPPPNVQVANAIMDSNKADPNKQTKPNAPTQLAQKPVNKVSLLETGAKDVGIACPQVEGRAVNTFFSMAKFCAQLSSIAYSIGTTGASAPRAGTPLQVGSATLTVHKVIIPPSADNYGLGQFNGPYMIVSDATNIYVVFRGSYSLQDWLDDFAASFTRLTIGGEAYGFVHTGFYNLWLAQDTIPNLQQVTRAAPTKKIIITGHSLGGAVATLTALEIALIYGINPQLYTYGSPRVGDLTFANLFRGLVTHLRFKNKEDLVPTVPAFYTPIFPPYPTSEETKPRLFYHADDAAIKMWGADSTPNFECIEDVTPWNPALPNPVDHLMEPPRGYLGSVAALN